MELRVRMETLRELSSQPPTPEGWVRLTGLFDRWEHAEDLTVGLDYAAGFLGRWPEALRVVPPVWRDVLLGAPRTLIKRRWQRGERAHPTIALARVLNLGHTRVNARQLKALGNGGPTLRHLTALEAGSAGVGDDEALLLSEVAHLDGLRRLNLSNNRLGPQGMWELVGSPLCRGLEALDVSGNPLGNEGARGIAQTPGLAGLRRLGLGRTHMGPAGFKTIIESAHLAHLTHLDLEAAGYDFGSRCLAMVPEARFAPTLESLSVAWCNVGHQEALQLMTGPFPALRSLDLSGCRMSAPQVRAIPADALPDLGTLVLRDVHASTLEAFRERFERPGLTILDSLKPQGAST